MALGKAAPHCPPAGGQPARRPCARGTGFHTWTLPAGRRRLHRVVADATANALGVAALVISPPIRRAGANGAAIEISAPVGVFMLTDDNAPAMNIRAPSLGQITMTMREALV